MTRTPTSLLRCLPSPSSKILRLPQFSQQRTIISPAPAQPSRTPLNTLTANTKSIDYRILSGIDGFIPKENFDRISEWQAGLWERLQGEVRSNPGLAPIKAKWDRSGLDMIDLINFTSRDPTLSLAFNYASLILNNSYFLEGLNVDPPEPVPQQFQILADKVEAYAEGIVGGAWLWLVKTGDSQAEVDIIPTFSSGTILITNRIQKGRQDLPPYLLPQTSTPPSEESVPDSDPSSPTTDTPAPAETDTEPVVQPRKTRSTFASLRNSSGAGGYPVPLAVLSLYEHAYLGEKYGVWGKGQYAKDWWKTLDWNKVLARSSKL